MFKLRELVVAIVYSLICFKLIKGQNIVHLAYHLHGTGAKWSTDADKCSNVPDKLAVEVTSINVRDACARLYDDINCEGASIEVLPHSPSQNDLRPWGFDNIAKSIGPCRNPCDPEAVGVQDPYEPVYVQIYNEKNHLGRSEKLRVVGCTPVPEALVDKILSINAHFHCIRLYNNINCDTDGVRGYDKKSIELRFGTPFHNDLSQWTFPEVKAISSCRFKCGNISGTASTTEKLNTEGTSNLKNKATINSENTEYAGSSTEILLIVTLVPLLEVILCVLVVLWIIRYYRGSVFSRKVVWAKHKGSLDGIENSHLGSTEAEEMSNSTKNAHFVNIL